MLGLWPFDYIACIYIYMTLRRLFLFAKVIILCKCAELEAGPFVIIDVASDSPTNADIFDEESVSQNRPQKQPQNLPPLKNRELVRAPGNETGM